MIAAINSIYVIQKWGVEYILQVHHTTVMTVITSANNLIQYLTVMLYWNIFELYYMDCDYLTTDAN